MKILFIAVSNNPFDATQGASQRSNLLLRACAKIAHVDVISFCSTIAQDKDGYHIIHQEDWHNRDTIGRLRKFRQLLSPWKPDTLYPIDHHKEQIVKKAVDEGNYDYIVIRYIPHAIMCGLMQYASRLIIDIDDNPVLRTKYEIKSISKFRNRCFSRLHAIAISIGMRKILSRIHLAFVSNPDDLIDGKTIFLPNVPYYELHNELDENKELNNRIVFVGDLGFQPNQLGMSRFLENVYSVVYKEIPNIELHIVGQIWDESLQKKWESYQGVTVMGFVPSLLDEYSEACVCIIPVYSGAGTCIKVLEAMQMKKICITTIAGFRGYNNIFVPNEDCLVAENDEDFAKKIIMAINDKELRRKITVSAHVKQQKYYTQNTFFQVVSKNIIYK